MKTKSPCRRIGRLGPTRRTGAHQAIALRRVRTARESLPPLRLGQKVENAVLAQLTRDEAMENIARAGVNPRGMFRGQSRAVNDPRALHPVGGPLVTGKGDSPAVLNVITAARPIRKTNRLDAAIVGLDMAVSASLSLAGRNAEPTPKRTLNAETLQLNIHRKEMHIIVTCHEFQLFIHFVMNLYI